MRLGVIGAGRHANNALYPAIIESGLELVAVCARTPRHAQAAAHRWGAPDHFTSVADMLTEGGLDGVVMAVGANAYSPLIQRCIEARLPVFCEKPAGRSARELRELAHAASAQGCPVVVGYMKRFAPAYRGARDLISSPRFGAPSLAHFSFTMGRVDQYLADPRHYLIDNPVHMIDMARYLVGELSDISALVDRVPDFGLSVSLIARAESGAACSFDFCTTASFAHRGESAEVFGIGDAVLVDNVDTCVYRPVDGPAEVWRPNYTLPVPANSGLTTMGFIPALQHFRDVAGGSVPNESDLESAARTLETTERLWEQIRGQLA
ncbi:Gfo/Idh/MocA family protein [Humibacter ginsengisoli]